MPKNMISHLAHPLQASCLVFDVSNSKLWKNGRHYEHWSGQDLTEELKGAPHAAWVFDKFDPVAVLKL